MGYDKVLAWGSLVHAVLAAVCFAFEEWGKPHARAGWRSLALQFMTGVAVLDSVLVAAVLFR